MSNKDEALQAKDLAEEMMRRGDFTTARRIALKAQKMDASLENIVAHMVMVCDVHCAALERVEDETDWYKILQVDQNADVNTIKTQYRKFALHLHPDKNILPGAESAFKMIGEAHRVLLDKDQRRLHDLRRKPFRSDAPASSYRSKRAPAPHLRPVFQKNLNATANGKQYFARQATSQDPPVQPNLSENHTSNEKKKRKIQIETSSDSFNESHKSVTSGQDSVSKQQVSTGFCKTFPNGKNKTKEVKEDKVESSRDSDLEGNGVLHGSYELHIAKSNQVIRRSPSSSEL